MELSELPSTQSGAQHRPILVNVHGIPLKINLQAVELEGRPKLVRTLKSSGALVMSNAKEAAIILVDSATESGKRLIRTWGHDTSKVVLEHTWARASIDTGRPLLETDSWGGALTIDDGEPVTIDGVVVDEDELEVEALVTKSPLPTPRITPVDLTPISQRPENSATERADTTRSESSTSASRVMGLPPPGPPVTQPALTFSEKSVVDIHNTPPLASPPPPPVTQPLSYLQPSLFVYPSQSQNTYAHAPSPPQQVFPSQPQVMPTQPPTGFPSSQPQMVHASSVSHTPLPSDQSQMLQIPPNTPSINGGNLQTSNFAAIMTIMDVVRHMDQSSWFRQNQPSISQPPTNSNTSEPGPTSSASITGRFESPGVSVPLSSPQDRLSDTVTASRKSGSGAEVSEGRSTTRSSKPSRRSPDEISTPSIRRKRSLTFKLTGPPPKRSRKSKGKADSEHSEVDELTEASEGSYTTRSFASPPVRPRNAIAHKKHGEIFLSGSGQPLRFFVQVDLHGRHTVVTNIKKNKGKIVNSIADADYLILFARSGTFRGLLNEAIALGKSPILAAFVADCIEEGALLDEADYVLESAAKVKPSMRGRQNPFSVNVGTSETPSHKTKVAKPKTSLVTGESKMLRETPSKSRMGKKSKKAPNSASPKAITEGRGDSTTSRSPTPPPPATRQLMNNGRYLFTEIEDEYSLRLAKYHLTRDPAISNTALVRKVHKKMPHHTAASWAAHVDKKVKNALEDIRKRANIANRKRAHDNANQDSIQGVVNKDMPCPSEGRALSTAQGNENALLKPGYPSQEDPERQDFDAITEFFALGGGDDDDDERVWQQLAKHQRCRSASSWPEYYAAHEKEVYARIEELMRERAGD